MTNYLGNGTIGTPIDGDAVVWNEQEKKFAFTSGVVESDWVDITNAEFLTLGSVGKPVGGQPAPNAIRLVIQAVLYQFVTSGHEYSTATSDNHLAFLTTTESFTQSLVYLPKTIWSAVSSSVPQIFPFVSFPTGAGVYPGGPVTDGAGVEPILLAADGDPTGGNAANVNKIKIWYVDMVLP